MAAEEADHEGDCGDAEKERCDESDGEHVGLGKEPGGLACVEQGLRARSEDHGGCEEEREPRRLFSIELANEAGRDRDARARDAGEERDRLSGAHEQCVDDRQVADRSALPRDGLRGNKDDRSDDQTGRDEDRTAQLSLDRGLKEHAGDRRRCGAEHDERGHPPAAAEHIGHQADPCAGEVEEHGEGGAEVQGDVEAEPETFRIELEHVAGENEMRGRAHRKEFGEPLDHPEDRRRRRVVHRIERRAAASASRASRSFSRTASRFLAHARR